MTEPVSLSPTSHPESHGSPASTDFRLMELEIENSRLQRLVAELLLKNQQLRKHEEGLRLAKKHCVEPQLWHTRMPACVFFKK